MSATAETPPPTPPPEVAPVIPTPSTHTDEQVASMRLTMVNNLYALFTKDWEPMVAACQEKQNFSQSPNKGKVLEKLPEGETNKNFYNIEWICPRTCPIVTRFSVFGEFEHILMWYKISNFDILYLDNRGVGNNNLYVRNSAGIKFRISIFYTLIIMGLGIIIYMFGIQLV
jgi:hypothetical protein